MGNALYRLIRKVAGTDLQVEMAARAGVDQTAISRWKKGGNFSTDNAIAVGRALGLSPVEVLVEVGLITRQEADVVVHVTERAEPTNEQLLELLRDRLAMTRPDLEGGGGVPHPEDQAAIAASRERARRATSRREGST